MRYIKVDNDHNNEDYADDDDKDNYDDYDDKRVKFGFRSRGTKSLTFLDCRLFRKADQKILGNSGNSSFVARVFCSSILVTG